MTLTAEGKVFLDECRDLLRRIDEAVSRTRASARGEYGVLHVGYAPSPTLELLPQTLASFQKAVPNVRVILHDMAANELCAGLLDGSLELAVMVRPAEYACIFSYFEVIPVLCDSVPNSGGPISLTAYLFASASRSS